jgi:hypothetical protein
MALSNLELAFGAGLILFNGVILQWFISRIRAGKKPFIRKMQGLIGIEEAAGRCAEMGQRFACNVSGSLTGSQSHTVAAGYSILTYAMRACARTGAEPVIPYYGSAEVLPMYYNIVEQAYAAEGQSEAYRPEYVQQIALSYASNFTYMGAIAALLDRGNIGATLWVGQVASVNSVVAEVNGISIQGTGYLSNIMITGLIADYSFIGEELFAAGAMISQNPMMMASIQGMDIDKYIALGLMVLFIPLVAAGVAL